MLVLDLVRHRHCDVHAIDDRVFYRDFFGFCIAVGVAVIDKH